MRRARFALSNRPPDRKLDGSIVIWTESMFAGWLTRASAFTLTTYCSLSVGGPASIKPATFWNENSPNRRSWSICVSSPVYNHGLAVPPSTHASPSLIGPSATSFRTPLARSPEDSIKPICAAGRWAWPDPAGQSAGCELRNPNAASCRYPSTKWLASGPVFAPLVTWP